MASRTHPAEVTWCATAEARRAGRPVETVDVSVQAQSEAVARCELVLAARLALAKRGIHATSVILKNLRVEP